MNDSRNRPPTAVTEQFDDLIPKYCSAVLRYFHQHPTEAATIDELGDFVGDLDPPDEGRVRVATHCHHATLPKLAAHGPIDYDPHEPRGPVQRPPADR